MSLSITAKKIKYDNADVVSEYAVKDVHDEEIIKTYARKPFLSVATPSGDWIHISTNAWKIKLTIPEFNPGGIYETESYHYKIDIQTDIATMDLVVGLGAQLFYVCTDIEGTNTTFWVYGKFVDDTKPRPLTDVRFNVLCTDIKGEQ